MFNLELTDEEKEVLCNSKYTNLDFKEIEHRIQLHNKECDKLLKILKKKEDRKKHYDIFKK